MIHLPTSDEKYPVNRTKKFYRYNAWHYCDGCSDINAEVFYLHKETKCGYWIVPQYGSEKRWVSSTATKRYAYPTKAEALVNFVARKRCEINILENRMRLSKRALSVAIEKQKE